MIDGVNKAFEKKLILEGIGYRSEVQGKDMVMNLGFSHQVRVPIPDGLKVVVEKTAITVSGINKEEVGAFAAKLREFKPPEPYKGKGMRYDGEVIRRKQGKKSTA
jgi:large subunit ribosomal protein L6